VRFWLLLVALAVASAHDPITTRLTWSAEVSRIVYERCAGCHRDGGKAPMSLLTYEEVRPWAKAIRDEVLARRMPPWGAVKGYGDFLGDISLTQEEITRIAEWVEGGAPEGDRRYLPPEPPPPESDADRAVEGRRLRNPSKFGRSVQVLGIAPGAGAATGKVYATLPGGNVEPLLWLLNYRSEWQRTYVYTKPVTLPAGSRIIADIPFELVVKSPKPGR
jgi:hypothetical protein